MKWMRFLLLTLMLGLSATAAAALPTADLLRKNLAGLGERKLPEAEQQNVQQALEQTLVWVEQAAQTGIELQALEQQLQEAPQKIRQNRQALADLLQDAQRQPLPAQASQQELESLIAGQAAQLERLHRELSQANALIVRTQTRPERAQNEIGTTQRRIQQIQNELKVAREGGKPLLLSERMDALNAELEALQERNRLRQAELAGNSMLQDLASSERELLATRVQTSEDRLLALQALLNEQRQAASERTVLEQSLEVERAGEDALLLSESNLNLKLSDYLLKITELRNELTNKDIQVRQQLDNLRQVDQTLEEHIGVMQGSVLLAKILYQQKQMLPPLTVDRGLAEQIADVRLNQFELRQYRASLQRPEDYVATKLGDDGDDNPEMRQTLLELARIRHNLLERLNHELNAYLSEAIAIQLNQRQLQTVASQLRSVLDEQMFWVPSNRSLGVDWLKSLPKRLVRQIAALKPGQMLVDAWQLWRDHWTGFFPALLLSVLVFWKRKLIRTRIDYSADRIGHYLHDRQHYTPVALAALVLLTLPGISWLASAGWLAQRHGEGAVYGLGVVLFKLAQHGLIFIVAYRLLAPDGLARRHLQWERTLVVFLRHRIGWIGLVSGFLLALVPLAQVNLAGLSDDALGVLLLGSGLLLLSWLLGRLVMHEYIQKELPWLGRMAGWVMAGVPLVLAIALVSGYYYTVLQLTERLVLSLGLLIVWLVLRAVLERGLTIAARRLAWQRVQAMQEPGGDEAQSGETQPDLIQSNEQSLRLVRFFLLLGFAVVLYWVWADVISLMNYLDTVTLYDGSQPDGQTGLISLLSLRSVLDALVIIGVSVMLARNLPALLDVLFLSRFKVTQGNSYAMLRLLSYTISSVGIIATLAALGVSWNKLQWLVAALSLGLGFGLQEIFANFVSGLIILFEKPVRIGDLVTIDNMTGHVSRLRIRATTITGLDRKEIVVPNKVFVTERLINWSLTDNVTRIDLNISLAYDSDVALARTIMMQTMQENSRVLEDPEPMVLFMEVGSSGFKHEMRYHVGEIADRNLSIDEIHNRLVERFRDAQIEMAFDQLDVYIKNRQGDEAHWSTRQRPPTVRQ